VDTGQPIRKFPGTTSTTFATFSTEGKYIVAGAVGGMGFVWNKNGKKMFELDDLEAGHPIDRKAAVWKWDKTGLIPQPAGFKNAPVSSDSIYSLKFIDADHYLRFTTDIPYAILYSVNSSLPLKYIPLGSGPMPSIGDDDYSRDEFIDTAPAANILVTGQETGSGIIVYKYDPKIQTLTKIWVSQA